MFQPDMLQSCGLLCILLQGQLSNRAHKIQKKCFLVCGHQKQHSQGNYIVGISLSLLIPLSRWPFSFVYFLVDVTLMYPKQNNGKIKYKGNN